VAARPQTRMPNAGLNAHQRAATIALAGGCILTAAESFQPAPTDMPAGLGTGSDVRLDGRAQLLQRHPTLPLLHQLGCCFLIY
jgi:hypothetical protein